MVSKRYYDEGDKVVVSATGALGKVVEVIPGSQYEDYANDSTYLVQGEAGWTDEYYADELELQDES